MSYLVATAIVKVYTALKPFVRAMTGCPKDVCLRLVCTGGTLGDLRISDPDLDAARAALAAAQLPLDEELVLHWANIYLRNCASALVECTVEDALIAAEIQTILHFKKH